MSLAEEVAALLPQGLITGYVGVVASLGTGGATVNVRGALLVCSGSSSYAPAVGDNVMVMRVDTNNSWVIAFKITAGGEPWKPFPYLNGWANYTDPKITPMQYRRNAQGETQIRGFAWSPSTWNAIVGKLPVEYGSSNQQMVYANAFGTAQSGFRVDPDGTVRAFGDSRTSSGWWVNGSISRDMG